MPASVAVLADHISYSCSKKGKIAILEQNENLSTDAYPGSDKHLNCILNTFKIDFSIIVSIKLLNEFFRTFHCDVFQHI